jgi:hypothetical protein
MNPASAAATNASAGSRFNRRAFYSLLLCTAGLLLPWSGYQMHVLDAATLSQARHFWMSVHNSAAVLFLFAGIMHVVLNRKALGRYLKRAGSMVVSREALAAFALVAGLVGLFALHAQHVH